MALAPIPAQLGGEKSLQPRCLGSDLASHEGATCCRDSVHMGTKEINRSSPASLQEGAPQAT